MRSLTVVAVFATAPVGSVLAVESALQESTPETRLELEFVITSESDDGERSERPSTIQLEANDEVARLQVGTEVPVPVMSFDVDKGDQTSGGTGEPVTHFQYRNVGTNLTARARPHADGFLIRVSLEESSTAGTQRVGGLVLPRFRTFNYHHRLLMKDGETAEIVTTHGPERGELRRARITLRVLP